MVKAAPTLGGLTMNSPTRDKSFLYLALIFFDLALLAGLALFFVQVTP